MSAAAADGGPFHALVLPLRVVVAQGCGLYVDGTIRADQATAVVHAAAACLQIHTLFGLQRTAAIGDAAALHGQLAVGTDHTGIVVQASGLETDVGVGRDIAAIDQRACRDGQRTLRHDAARAAGIGVAYGAAARVQVQRIA
jgi:hypothetical protein